MKAGSLTQSKKFSENLSGSLLSPLDESKANRVYFVNGNTKQDAKFVN